MNTYRGDIIMDKIKEAYYEKLKANKQKLESKENLEVTEKCALTKLDRIIAELDCEKFFEDVANNNGRASKKSDLDSFFAK